MIVQFPRETKVVDLQEFAARRGKKLRFLPALSGTERKPRTTTAPPADHDDNGPSAA